MRHAITRQILASLQETLKTFKNYDVVKEIQEGLYIILAGGVKS